jgi:hypothetical protein
MLARTIPLILLIMCGWPPACAGLSAPLVQCKRRPERPPQAAGLPHRKLPRNPC